MFFWFSHINLAVRQEGACAQGECYMAPSSVSTCRTCGISSHTIWLIISIGTQAQWNCLKLWTSEVQNRSPWASHGAGRTAFPQEGLRENCFQLLEVAVFFGSWLLPPSRIVAPSQRLKFTLFIFLYFHPVSFFYSRISSRIHYF